MNDALHAVLTLTFTPGLGPRKIKGLLEHFGSAEALSGATPSELTAVEGIGRKLAESIAASRTTARTKADAELARVERLGVTLLSLSSPEYPESLAQIYDPPPVLYVRGALPVGVRGELSDLRSLGVVGTRNASPYGLGLSRRLSRELAAGGVAIVFHSLEATERGVDFGVEVAVWGVVMANE